MIIIINNYDCGVTFKKLGEIHNPINTLQKAIKCLSDYVWWLSVGTAIGLYRDGDFIPTDTDIDIGIKVDGIVGYITIPGMKLIRTTEVIMPVSGARRLTQLFFIDEENSCPFDIYFYYSDIKDNHLVTVSEFGVIHKPNFTIKHLETKYGRFPFLHPIEDYFFDRYGETWRTPQDVKGKYYQKF